MRKTAVRPTIFLSPFFIAFLLLLIFSPISHAETLADVKREIVDYQSQPLERIKTLKAEVRKIQGLEEGLARQYSIPVSQVINYEMMLENNIHVYHSIYVLQKQGTAPSQFILEEGRLEELAEKTPPYSFLLYLDFLEDVENYLNEADRYKRLIDKAKAAILRNNGERDEVEKRFRLVNDLLSRVSGNNLNNSWRMREIMAKLEECTAINTLYTTTLSLAEKELKDTEGKIAIIKPMLDNIRKNIKFSSEDFVFLNKIVLDKTTSLYDTISMLEKKIDPANEFSDDATEMTQFT
ncbi:MAG: hypothetical protein WC922_07780, partial [Synergistaceae bacterium]